MTIAIVINYILLCVIMYMYCHYTGKINNLQHTIKQKEFEIERHLSTVAKLMKPIKEDIKKEFRKLTK